MDYAVVYIQGQKHCVLKIVDVGTRYGESDSTINNATCMMSMMEEEYIYHHEAPKRFRTDPEFCRLFFEIFINAHDI